MTAAVAASFRAQAPRWRADNRPGHVWAERRRHRRGAEERLLRSEEHYAVQLRVFFGTVSETEVPGVPDADDPRMSKRVWASSVMLWRATMRNLADRPLRMA